MLLIILIILLIYSIIVYVNYRNSLISDRKKNQKDFKNSRWEYWTKHNQRNDEKNIGFDNFEGMTFSLPSNMLPSNSIKIHQEILEQGFKSSGQIGIGATYQIDYRTAQGELTSRTITINSITRDHRTTYINAYCHLRNEDRTFHLDRIIGYITDNNTGEILDPNILSPLKKTIIVPTDIIKSAIHLEIAEHDGSWFLYHPRCKCSKKSDREKLALTSYRYQIDAYKTAINRTIESSANTLLLYFYGKYVPYKIPENASKINIIMIDTSTMDGMAKKKES